MLFRRLLTAAALAGFLGGSACAQEQPAGGELLTVKQASVGLGGKYKAGFWQPIRVTLAAGPAGARGRLEAIIHDGDQTPVVYADPARGDVDLAAGSQASYLLYAKSGPLNARMTLRLRQDTQVVWSQTISPLAGSPLASTDELAVNIGPPVGLEEAVAQVRRARSGLTHAAAVTAASELPDRWWGYDGVDCLVLTTSDADFMAAMTPDQQRAIIDWTLLGGRLVLCAGARSQSIAAAESPWAALIPGEIAEIEPLRERSGLEQFTKSELPFEDELFRRQRPMVARLKNTRGEVRLEEVSSLAGRPLITRASAGLGEITFVGLDIDHPALAAWKGRPRLVAALLPQGAAERGQTDRGESHQRIRHLGYDDLSGQLRAALDQFPNIAMVNFTTVSMLTLAYLLLIGPGDFLLLSRLALPRHLTWLTFSLVAIVTGGVAIYASTLVHGRLPRLNQVEIVDLDIAHQRVRGTVLAHCYSPATRQYDLALTVVAPGNVKAGAATGWLAWHGLPGDALGGLESQQPALFSRQPYEVAAPGTSLRMQGVMVPVASSKALSGCWEASSRLDAQTNLLIDRYGHLAGELRQPLPIRLTDALLAHGDVFYRLGTLEPGQRVALAGLQPLNLEARLTQSRVEQSKDVSTPWQQDSVDVPRIVQMMMFHRAARGQAYTGLTHRYQSRLDLSEHVRLGEALLIGRADVPASRLTTGPAGSSEAVPLVDDSHAQYSTWYRIILPVKRQTRVASDGSR